ncbi:MAG: reprolysin-like metallopeptidase [Pyrinomonadaceae bacterium]
MTLTVNKLFAVISLFIAAAGVSNVFAGSGDVWQPVASESIRSRNRLAVDGNKFLVYRFDDAAAKAILRNAPMEFSADAQTRIFVFQLPMPDGKFESFRVVESPVLSPALQAEYPDWRTYQAFGIDDRSATARFGITLNGFHASVFSTKGTVVIDPITIGDPQNYIVYSKRDLTKPRNFHCLLDETLSGHSDTKYSFFPAPEFSHGSQIRTYRLAIAATGEYTAVFGNQTNGLAQVTTTANRMNGIYRKDFAVGLQLVSGTNLVYPDAATDPYTNVINGSQLDANQTNINTVLGAGGYDVGHLFATSNNGLAQLNSICTAGKARGASGQPNPQGDGFDVDYVAHEIGHQIGGNHTFNSDPNCGGGATAARKEPGSGVTIMSYAGICSSTANLQRNSIDNFLGHSQQEAITFLGGTGGTCGTLSGSNSIPVVTSPGASFSIPFNTPYALTASASDANGDALTYSWEHDTSSGGSTSNYPATTDDDDTNLGASRILMRPNIPSASPTRIFPSLTYILNAPHNEPPVTYTGTSATGAICAATCITGEDLPSVARTINYRVVVRDGQGGVADATTAVTFVNTTTPFTVTSQNTAVTYSGNSSQTVTWNVSGTTAAPISAANVKISLSTDGGTTFPNVLAASTANDGSETVTIPNTASTTARIKVEAVGNIFFDINNANITINAVAATRRAPFDYDGDDRTDISIFRPALGEWWYQRSSTGVVSAGAFGTLTDKIVPGDYTGDQKTDIAFWRPSTGEWFVLRSEDSSFFAFPFGATGDVPVPGDYDNDGKMDPAVFRPATNTWFVLKSGGGGVDFYTFGTGGDKPVVADYDGDNKTDIAIFRPASGQWWIRRSSDAGVSVATFGLSTDRPVQGYYTPDNKVDVAFWRPSTGEWFVLRSEDSSFAAAPFGSTGDIPTPGDYDGDDRFDLVVYRPSSTTWFLQRTTAGLLFQNFGLSTDLPTPNAFVPAP